MILKSRTPWEVLRQSVSRGAKLEDLMAKFVWTWTPLVTASMIMKLLANALSGNSAISAEAMSLLSRKIDRGGSLLPLSTIDPWRADIPESEPEEIRAASVYGDMNRAELSKLLASLLFDSEISSVARFISPLGTGLKSLRRNDQRQEIDLPARDPAAEAGGLMVHEDIRRLMDSEIPRVTARVAG